jgi:hypothetical protein
MTLFSMGLFRRYGRVTDQQHRGFLDFLGSKGWWQTICEVHPDVGAEAWMDILRAYGEGQQTDTLFELWMDSFPRLYRIARWLDTYVHLFQTLDRRDSKLAKFLLSPASDPSLSGSGIEAPTLSGMLRLGQHLVIRELLRLESPVLGCCARACLCSKKCGARADGSTWAHRSQVQQRHLPCPGIRAGRGGGMFLGGV